MATKGETTTKAAKPMVVPAKPAGRANKRSGEVGFLSGGEVVKNGDRAAGGEAADEVAADKAGATGDEEIHG